MSAFFEQILYCVLTDGIMNYPVFAEVEKGKGEVDVEHLKRLVSRQYQVAVGDLKIVSYPRWATRIETPEGHVVHIGMLPRE